MSLSELLLRRKIQGLLPYFQSNVMSDNQVQNILYKNAEKQKTIMINM